MRNIVFIALVSLLSTACPATRVVENPAPVAPAAAAPAEKPAKLEEPKNHAAELVALVRPLKEQGFKCNPWTGTGTAFPGVDSFLCEGPTQLIWCGAPTNAPPACTPSVDWTPGPIPTTSASGKDKGAKGK